MNIKPCPACKSKATGLVGVVHGIKRHCLSCGVSGPWVETPTDGQPIDDAITAADTAWNALPRQGDESPSPDRPLTRRMAEITREALELLTGFPEDTPLFGSDKNTITTAEARELLKEWE